MCVPEKEVTGYYYLQYYRSMIFSYICSNPYYNANIPLSCWLLYELSSQLCPSVIYIIIHSAVLATFLQAYAMLHIWNSSSNLLLFISVEDHVPMVIIYFVVYSKDIHLNLSDFLFI